MTSTVIIINPSEGIQLVDHVSCNLPLVRRVPYFFFTTRRTLDDWCFTRLFHEVGLLWLASRRASYATFVVRFVSLYRRDAVPQGVFTFFVKRASCEVCGLPCNECCPTYCLGLLSHISLLGTLDLLLFASFYYPHIASLAVGIRTRFKFASLFEKDSTLKVLSKLCLKPMPLEGCKRSSLSKVWCLSHGFLGWSWIVA